MGDMSFETVLEEIYGEKIPDSSVRNIFYDVAILAVRKAIAVMTNRIYDYDISAFRKDAAKVAITYWHVDFDLEEQECLKLLRVIWQEYRDYFHGDYKDRFKVFMELEVDVFDYDLQLFDTEKAVGSVYDLSKDPDAQRFNKLYGKEPLDYCKLDVLLRVIRRRYIRVAATEMVKALLDLRWYTRVKEAEMIDIDDWKEPISLEPKERRRLLHAVWCVYEWWFNDDIEEMLSFICSGQWGNKKGTDIRG